MCGDHTSSALLRGLSVGVSRVVPDTSCDVTFDDFSDHIHPLIDGGETQEDVPTLMMVDDDTDLSHAIDDDDSDLLFFELAEHASTSSPKGGKAPREGLEVLLHDFAMAIYQDTSSSRHHQPFSERSSLISPTVVPVDEAPFSAFSSWNFRDGPPPSPKNNFGRKENERKRSEDKKGAEDEKQESDDLPHPVLSIGPGTTDLGFGEGVEEKEKDLKLGKDQLQEIPPKQRPATKRSKDKMPSPKGICN
jgi:hypothetical protein